METVTRSTYGPIDFSVEFELFLKCVDKKTQYELQTSFCASEFTSVFQFVLFIFLCTRLCVFSSFALYNILIYKFFFGCCFVQGFSLMVASGFLLQFVHMFAFNCSMLLIVSFFEFVLMSSVIAVYRTRLQTDVQ